LVVLVVGAASLVVMAARGDGGDSAGPPLPVALAGAGSGAAAETMAVGVANSDLALPVVYVPGEGLPDLGGSAPAYRLDPSGDEEAVRRVAAALGLDGDPTERDGTWHVDGDPLMLDVDTATGAWFAYPRSSEPLTETMIDPAPPSAAGSGVPSCEPSEACDGGAGAAGAPGAGPSVHRELLAERCPPADGSAPSCEVVSAQEVPPVERPADLLSEDEARRIALDLLDAAGTDVAGADVQVDDLLTQWAVTAEPLVGGVPSPDLAAFVTVGAAGRVEAASGHLVGIEDLGDYPRLDTRAALDRINEGGWGYGTPVPLPEPVPLPAPATEERSASGPSMAPGTPPTTLAPPAPPPARSEPGTPPARSAAEPAPADPSPASRPDAGVDAPNAGTDPPQPAVDTPIPHPTQVDPDLPAEPLEVRVTDAEAVLVALPSWDETGTYLVPGYRYTAEDGSTPMVPAVTDEALAPPPADPPRTTEGARQPAGPADSGREPAAGPEEPVASPGGPATPPEIQTVEVSLYHCGLDPLVVDGQTWVADPPPFDGTNAPPEFVSRGTFAVAPDGTTAAYTDESGITVTFTAVDETWEPPACY
jgi:hypothetical protein